MADLRLQEGAAALELDDVSAREGGDRVGGPAREVRLVHGRGRGVQRRRVHEVLAASPLVERFADAPPERGGWGATIVWLGGGQEA